MDVSLDVGSRPAHWDLFGLASFTMEFGRIIMVLNLAGYHLGLAGGSFDEKTKSWRLGSWSGIGDPLPGLETIFDDYQSSPTEPTNCNLPMDRTRQLDGNHDSGISGTRNRALSHLLPPPSPPLPLLSSGQPKADILLPLSHEKLLRRATRPRPRPRKRPSSRVSKQRRPRRPAPRSTFSAPRPSVSRASPSTRGGRPRDNPKRRMSSVFSSSRSTPRPR